MSRLIQLKAYAQAIRISESTTAHMTPVAAMADLTSLIDVIRGNEGNAEDILAFTLAVMRMVPGSRTFLLAKLDIPVAEASGVADGLELEEFLRNRIE
jgi:hypothetical protein